MDGLVVLFLVIGALFAFAALALRLGVDSRAGSADPRRPEGGISI